MVTKTQEQILQLLLSQPEKQSSIRQIARTLNKSYTLTYNNLQALFKQGVVEKQELPPAQIISLSEKTPASLLVDIERKRTEAFLEKHPWLKLYLKDVLNAAEKPFFIMLAFGSYAKGTETKSSDLDLLVLAPAKEDIPAVEKALQQYTRVKKGIIVIDARNFVEMIKNPKTFNVGNEAKKHHIVLYGAEQYYQLLKKA
ncbi:MAG: nucleotidyltransferase domain-containing protein [Candidatus Woesearchaeota archaeon]|nr:nucleotidyltransferase domain-containing protein [Candidatus Woesearchaeota archaeon]